MTMSSSILLAALVLSAPPAAEPWTPGVQESIALVATNLMPHALAAQMIRHIDSLRAGALSPYRNAEEPVEYHALHADGRFGLASRKVEQQVTKIVSMLEGHAPFEDVVFEFGVLSHYVADVSWPLATSDADEREPSYAADMAGYVEHNLAKFPAVFYGYYPFQSRAFSLQDYLRDTAQGANRFYPLISQSYYPKAGGRMVSSRSFDDKSPAFGIAQISYNRAVSAVANVWLHAWRESHGDLAGLGSATRYLSELPETSAAQRQR